MRNWRTLGDDFRTLARFHCTGCANRSRWGRRPGIRSGRTTEEHGAHTSYSVAWRLDRRAQPICGSLQSHTRQTSQAMLTLRDGESLRNRLPILDFSSSVRHHAPIQGYETRRARKHRARGCDQRAPEEHGKNKRIFNAEADLGKGISRGEK